MCLYAYHFKLKQICILYLSGPIKIYTTGLSFFSSRNILSISQLAKMDFEFSQMLEDSYNRVPFKLFGFPQFGNDSSNIFFKVVWFKKGNNKFEL